MDIQERDFIPIILGSDINTYGMSRAFYEAYQIKSIVIGKFPSGPSCHSKIIDYYTEFNMDQPDVFIKRINDLAMKFADKKILLIGCGDSYVELIVKHKHLLRENVIAPYIDEQLMNKLLTKKSFYEMCEKYQLDYPQTLLYNQREKKDLILPFDFPVIVKPSNSIRYWECNFEGQEKVYRINNYVDLRQVVDKIYQAGYDDSLIIQEFIPGDDSHLRIMVSYSGRDKKVKIMSLAQVMLEEYTPQGLGSASILITDYNPELSAKLKSFLEDIGYTGFATFDIKYDPRDGKYKLLEINCRQGRSSYYVTAAGHNLAQYVAGEHVYNQSFDFQIARNRILWTVIPLPVAFKYIKNPDNRKAVKELMQNKKIVRSLYLKGDYKFKRLLFLYKAYLGHFLKYRKYYPR